MKVFLISLTLSLLTSCDPGRILRIKNRTNDRIMRSNLEDCLPEVNGLSSSNIILDTIIDDKEVIFLGIGAWSKKSKDEIQACLNDSEDYEYVVKRGGVFGQNLNIVIEK